MIAALAVAAGAAAQAITGIGFALVCAPFLVAVFGATEGVQNAVLLGIVLNAAMLAREHRHVLVRDGLLLLVPALVATPVVAWAISGLDADALAVVAGLATIVASVVLALARPRPHRRSPAAAAAAGVSSATMNVVAAIGGPAAALYALGAGWPPQRTRSTLQGYFLVLNVATLAALGLPRVRPVLVLGLAFGWLVGSVIADRVDERAIRTGILVVAAAGGLVAMGRGLF